ncbi:alpha/beta fold hydrolase [Streptomyces justiciae]|uniref:alpha/beta fold hydrolase n=1 Tax=Streptomyces justiciae TaxID=2780140 RepID=UPI0022437E35|nr:alpha/beta hydrolase [Streptomyces justiciae]MCW8379692.1 alpha/beta hydrolase [Streptomyces justiciae]
MTTAPTPVGAAFAEATVEADDFTIRYYEAGEGDPLVVLHGGGGPRFSLALDLLARSFRVIMIELPGFGDEPNERTQTLAELAGTVDRTTRALGLDTYHLLGTSFGGFVATHVALDHPERLTTLVLEAPATFRVDSVAPGPDMDPDELVRAFRRHPEREPLVQLPDPATMARTWPLVRRLVADTPEYDEELVRRLSECPVRTLVVFGTVDGITPSHNGRTFRRAMPNCGYTLIYDAAHDIQADRPEAFADLVGDFLTRAWSFLLPEQSTLINP